jgi:hypothetical protein
MTISAPISIARSDAAVSVVKYGLPGAGREDDEPPLLEVRMARRRMYGSAMPLHLDRRQHARVRAARFQRVLQRQRVDHRRQHPHVVGVRAVHARRAAPEDVAAADHQRDLDAQAVDVDQLVGDLGQRG